MSTTVQQRHEFSVIDAGYLPDDLAEKIEKESATHGLDDVEGEYNICDESHVFANLVFERVGSGKPRFRLEVIVQRTTG